MGYRVAVYSKVDDDKVAIDVTTYRDVDKDKARNKFLAVINDPATLSARVTMLSDKLDKEVLIREYFNEDVPAVRRAKDMIMRSRRINPDFIKKRMN